MKPKPVKSAEQRVLRAAMRRFDEWRKLFRISLKRALRWNEYSPKASAMIRACAALAAQKGKVKR